MTGKHGCRSGVTVEGKREPSYVRKLRLGVMLVLAAGMLAACGKKAEPEGDKPAVLEPEADAGKDAGAQVTIVLEPEAGGAGNGSGSADGAGAAGTDRPGSGASGEADGGAGAGGGVSGEPDNAGGAGDSGHLEAENALKDRFGEDCIAGQTFQVELSQYDGPVWFVPYGPGEPGQELHMQIVRDGQILTDFPAYVPEGVNLEDFESLDAVSFYDINYDGNTDILTVATYGGRKLAAIYYGEVPEGAYGQEPYFYVRDRLSDKVSAQVEPLTVSQIRIYLSWGKKNGTFAGWQEAYETVARLCEVESDGNFRYDLIDFDGDGVLELMAGTDGSISLYTYSQGTVYTLMDQWSYGAMGNTGYEYSPGKNSLRNYNTDFAGAILYTTYMKAGQGHSLEPAARITFINFDDVNGNGILDPDEEDSIGSYGISYIDGAVATEEQCAAYDAGGYVYMEPEMSFEELREVLGS